MSSPQPPVRIAALALPCPAFAQFTYPRYAPLLEGRHAAAGTCLAVAAWCGDTPAGLALLAPAGAPGQRRLLSVRVAPSVRRQGVGRTLLGEAEALAREAGATGLCAVHSSRLAAREAFESLLRACGWEAPRELERRLAGRCGWVTQAAPAWQPLMARLQRHGFSLRDWSAITEADRAAIRNLIAGAASEHDRQLDPLASEGAPHLEPRLSFLIDHGSTLAGWVLCLRGTRGNLHYCDGYVVPRLQKRGWLPGTMFEACRRQAALFGPDSLASFDTAPGNEGMRGVIEALVRRHPAFSVWSDIRYRTDKPLA